MLFRLLRLGFKILDGVIVVKLSHAMHLRGSGENGTYVNEVTIGELELYEGQRILYLFDYGDSWEFNIVLEKIDSSSPLPLNPKIVEKKGKRRNNTGISNAYLFFS
jgi:hypothetical protein